MINFPFTVQFYCPLLKIQKKKSQRNYSPSIMITTTTMNHLRRNVFWKPSRSNIKWWQERKL